MEKKRGLPASQFFKRSPMFDSVEIVRSPRHPSVISGALRERIERIVKVDEAYGDATRALELMDELDAALLRHQLCRSLALVRKS